MEIRDVKKPATRLRAVKPTKAMPARPKILIFGKAGVGKTWNAIDFPSVYYIDSEGGSNLHQYTEKLNAAGGMYLGPEQGASDFKEVIEQVKALSTENHNFKTLIIDSLSKLFNNEIALEAERMESKGIIDSFGASRKPAIKLTRQLVNWIDRLDMNVIIICHEKALWAGEKQVGVTFDAWDKLEYELNLCLNIVKNGGSRIARVTKSRFDQFSEKDNFTWSFGEFSKIFGESTLTAPPMAEKIASDEQVLRFKSLIDLLKIEEDQVLKWLEKSKSEKIEEMSEVNILKCIEHLEKKLSQPVGA